MEYFDVSVGWVQQQQQQLEQHEQFEQLQQQLELQQLVQRQRKNIKVHENWEEESLWLLENIIRGTAVGECYVRAGRGLVVSCVVDG